MKDFSARRLFIVLVVVAMIAAACGGGDDETSAASDDGAGSDDGAPASDDGAPSGDDAAASDDGGGDGDGVRSLDLVPDGATDIIGNPAGQGFVELAGTRYDFVLDAACQQIFGAVQAAGGAADGSESRVDAFIPPENWETFDDDRFDPPEVSIEIGDQEWIAELGANEQVGTAYRDLTPEESSVTSFTNDGSFTEGEGIFFRRFNSGDIETAQGSFAFYCP
ncbi:MAG: hypothetical protein RIE08_08735 [Acidimicrobiales bacterium]